MKLQLQKRSLDLTENEVLEIVKHWYCKGSYAGVLQNDKGEDLEEIIDELIIDEDYFEITPNTRLDELMFNEVISCRLLNVIKANFNFNNYDPKVKDLYPVSISEFKTLRNVGKETTIELINLYEMLLIELLD